MSINQQHLLLLVFFSCLLCPVASLPGQTAKNVTSGHCTKAELIGTAVDCQAAATVLGLPGAVKTTISGGYLPPGCSWGNYHDGRLFFNTDKASTASCYDSFPNYMCLCVEPCPIGKFQNAESSKTCKLCLPDTYNDETGQALCKKCTGGLYPYSTETGQTSKSATCKGVGCSAGKYSSEVGTESLHKCKSCRAGTYNNEIERPSCKNCTAGTFSSEIGQTICLKCAGGQYSSETGVTSNTECKGRCSIGTYSSEVGKTKIKTCKSCKATMYNDETGRPSCKNCPQGWDTTGPGSTECSITTDVPLLVFVSFVLGGVFVLGIVFGIYCFRKKKKEHDVELGELYERDEINQSLLESATNPLEQDQFTILPSDLHLGPRIGAGGCGLVYKATLGANTVVAAKEIITAMMNPKDLKEFKHEARMLTQMNHPHVLRVLGFCTVLAENSTDDMEHKYIVTEFAPHGSLENAIESAIAVAKIIKETNSKVIKMPFTKIQALQWAVQIASGMAFCHGRGFMHRDLKPQNILLNEINKAVVADLGTVRNTGSGKNPDGSSSLKEEEQNEKFEAIKRQMTQGQSGVDVLLKTIHNEAMTDLIGTPMYMSPEQYRFTYSYPVDVYAYGLMMIRLFTLKLPYPKKICTMKQLMDGGRAGVLIPTKVKKRDVPDPIVLKVINDCLQKNPNQRPTFKEIEIKFSQALKNCQTTKNKETKTNGHLTSLDGTIFTLPSNKGEIKE